MWTTNFKLTLRNLLKNKTQSAILIGGLSIGMTACILLLQYVGFELSFDQFHSKKDHIYRVVNERIQNGDRVQKGTITYPVIGPTMKAEYPEIKNATRLAYTQDVIVRKDEHIESINNVIWADEHFFEIFDFKLLGRDDINLLDEPNEIVITQDVAERYFPGIKDNFEILIGEDLMVDNYTDPFKIVAITKDIPTNSTLQFEILLSYKSAIRYWSQGVEDSWTWSDFYHYLELEPNTDVAALETKFADFSQRHFRGSEVSGSEEIFTLQPLADAHLYSGELEYEIGRTSNGQAVWSLLIIALFILLIAWINYVNLSSVRAIERSKEVGVRKVIGATRSQLVRQFFTEALMVNMLSFFLAICLVQLIQPWFASNFSLDQDALSFFGSQQIQFYLFLSLIILIIGGVFLSGAYPAWLLSSTHVSSVLKGVFSKDLGGAWIRKSLVVVQFTLSIGLIIATWMVSKQIAYMGKQDLGIDVERVFTINSPEISNWDSTFITRMEAFKAELTKLPHVESASTSSRTPGNTMGRIFNIQKVHRDNAGQSFTSNFIGVDHSYAKTYGLGILEGRFFRSDDHNFNFNEIENIVINKAATKLLGFQNSSDAIDTELNFWNKNWRVVGVFDNYHQVSLHSPIEPVFLLPLYDTFNPISVKTSGNDLDQTLAATKSLYTQFFPGNPFNYEFVDDFFQQLYLSDQRFSRVLSFFTLLTILIACMGLFGLASFMTYQRTKEIGIRKVLGASPLSIIGLLSKDFLKLVCLSLVFAIPLSYYFIGEWLQDFAYRINMPWWVFAVSGILAIGLALITVGAQSLKAAIMNPGDSLKNE